MTQTTIGILLVVLCTLIEGFAQIFFKMSVLARATKTLWIALGLVLFTAEALIYTGALHFLDVSTAYPIGSLSFVVVTVLSWCLLGEKITPPRWIGVFLIIVGASLVVAQA